MSTLLPRIPHDMCDAQGNFFFCVAVQTQIVEEVMVASKSVERF